MSEHRLPEEDSIDPRAGDEPAEGEPAEGEGSEPETKPDAGE